MSDRFLIPRKLSQVPASNVIVCGGFGDVKFVQALLEHEKIQGCCVGCPTQDSSDADGDSGIPSYLGALHGLHDSGKGSIRRLLVVTDADDKRAAQLQLVKDALAFGEFPVPPNAYEFAQSKEFRTSIYLIPSAERDGTLEHLLLDAALKSNALMRGCLDEFAKCAVAPPKWTSNKQAKMKLASLVAAVVEDDP